MAKTPRQPKETSLPVIVALVFFVLTTIGLGVFVYVLYSDQEAKDKTVVDAKKEVTDMRAAVKDAELTARMYREYIGIGEGTGDQADLTVLQNEKMEGTKAYQKLQELNAAAKKRGPELAKDMVDKFEKVLEAYAKGAGPKIDPGTLLGADDFNLWPGDLDDKKQLKAPRGSLLEVAIRARLFRDAAIRAAGDDRVLYDKVVADVKAANKAFDDAKKAFNDKAAELPKSFETKIAALNKQLDEIRLSYQRNEAATRGKIKELEEDIEKFKLVVANKDEEIRNLNGTLRIINEKSPKQDPFAYDEPQGKISARPDDQIVEINIGSNAHVQAGLTFTVLPADFPQKGRISRVMKIRTPDDRGHYRDVEMFIPKATIEVIEVIGPDVSRARITSEFNDIRDRVLPGDLIYNAVWRKGQSDHVALVGIFDINGDGTDDIATVVRDFNRMGITVDAYLDLKTKKWVGKLTERTRYLVRGFSPTTTTNDPNVKDKTAILDAMKTASDDAVAKHVVLVPARDFFGRVGYKAKLDVSEDRINQAASKYLSGVGSETVAPPPP